MSHARDSNGLPQAFVLEEWMELSERQQNGLGRERFTDLTLHDRGQRSIDRAEIQHQTVVAVRGQPGHAPLHVRVEVWSRGLVKQVEGVVTRVLVPDVPPSQANQHRHQEYGERNQKK
jgi:hypothetical protein